MIRIFSRLQQLMMNISVCKRIGKFLDSSPCVFRIHWLGAYELLRPLGRMEDTRLIPVFNESDSILRQSLQAYQFHLALSYKKKARKITGVYYRAMEGALLRGLARSMGVEQDEGCCSFYTPDPDDHPDVLCLYKKMTVLDDHGLFRSVFLSELDQLPADGTDYTEELAGLLEFLEEPVPGSCYLNGRIRVGILHKNSCFAPSLYQRSVCEAFYRTGEWHRIPMENRPVQNRIFDRLVQETGIKKGHYIRCSLRETGPGAAVFDLNGLPGVLYREDFGWNLRDGRQTDFIEGIEYPLSVKSIDWVRGRVLLSNRKKAMNPKLKTGYPEVYSIVKIRMIGEYHCFLLGLYKNEFEIILPKSELPPDGEESAGDLIGRDFPVMIYHEDRKSRLYGSVRKL